MICLVKTPLNTFYRLKYPTLFCSNWFFFSAPFSRPYSASLAAAFWSADSAAAHPQISFFLASSAAADPRFFHFLQSFCCQRDVPAESFCQVCSPPFVLSVEQTYNNCSPRRQTRRNCPKTLGTPVRSRIQTLRLREGVKKSVSKGTHSDTPPPFCSLRGPKNYFFSINVYTYVHIIRTGIL